jgi:hypothetical protein
MLIREYLESGSISEARSAVQALLEAGSGRAGEGDRRLLLRHLVRKAVTIALDHDNRAKERVAQLLSALHPLVIHRCACYLHHRQLLSPPATAATLCQPLHRHPTPNLSPAASSLAQKHLQRSHSAAAPRRAHGLNSERIHSGAGKTSKPGSRTYAC